MPNPVVHFEINSGTPDGSALQDFYRQLFDWHVDSNNPMSYGFVDTHAGSGINGGVTASWEGHSASVSVYLELEDLDAYLKRIEAAGGKTLVTPTEVPNIVTFAVFQDPAGNAVGLVKAAG